MYHELNIPITVSTEQCRDILITATDTGGINYWETPFRNRVRDEELNCISFSVRCIDAVDPYWGKAVGDWVEVDEFTVIRGLRLIVANPLACAAYIRNGIIQMLGDHEDGISGCDLEQADVIIQIGLFGELVYG